MVISGVIGMSSSYIGGWISDKYDKKYPITKGLLNSISPLLSFPFILIAFQLSDNFYISISAYAFAYLTAETWYGPCVSQFPTLFPSQITGVAISIFLLAGALAGTCSSLLLGYLGDHAPEEDVDAPGRYLTIMVGVSYLGCSIPFFVGALMYRKFILG